MHEATTSLPPAGGGPGWGGSFVLVSAVLACACGDGGPGDIDAAAGPPDARAEPVDPDTAPRAEIDRFSAAAGTMFVRDDTNGLPGPGEPIDFDALFTTRGLGPAGQEARYYHFDVQPREAMTAYVFVRESTGEPLAEQLPVIDARPGGSGYSDYWVETRVLVPDDYVANTIVSAAEVRDAGFALVDTDVVRNRPLVPEGSTAATRIDDGPTGTFPAWYRGEIATYFAFAEGELLLEPDGIFEGLVPISTIYVTFNINPGDPGGGPDSGPMVEPGTDQTHNVVDSIPGDGDYSPLWHVYVYDNAEFDTVQDAETARSATFLAFPEGYVSCPIYFVGPRSS